MDAANKDLRGKKRLIQGLTAFRRWIMIVEGGEKRWDYKEWQEFVDSSSKTFRLLKILRSL